MNARNHRIPDRSRSLRRAGLAGALLFAVLAGLLWSAAGVLGARQCLDNGHGLGVEGGGMSLTERGCEITVPTTAGRVTGLVTTLSEPVAGAALVAGLAGAVPPCVCLWLVTRRRR
ncbi:hypothetical protein ACFPM3_17625 [Streptomyces coeruleoprunus]|uniref:Uncharacterized protein n=1 Tax=Streptomyces coeruleoprunus TaxID=285563 RepID=A0ABV9XFD0_9ACTN